jgi:3-oxoacyl-[acyl-carrier protein] reductase
MGSVVQESNADVGLGLSGKQAVVVGAGFGIGRAVARALAARGMRLALIERDGERLSAVCEELSAFGINVDVLAEGAARQAVEDARGAIGPLDVLVNVVGRGRPMSGLELTAKEQLEMMEVNYFHHVEFCSAFATACVRDGRPGALTLVSSLSALVPFPQRAAYGAAKAALGSLVTSLAVELGPRSIRVNAVAPGVVRTDRSQMSQEMVKQYTSAVPLGRLATQQDVANAVLFLCSDLSSYVTGQTLVLDGGASLYTRMWH